MLHIGVNLLYWVLSPLNSFVCDAYVCFIYFLPKSGKGGRESDSTPCIPGSDGPVPLSTYLNLIFTILQLEISSLMI